MYRKSVGKEADKTERKGRIIRWFNKVKELFKGSGIKVEDKRDEEEKNPKPEIMKLPEFEYEPESIYKEEFIKHMNRYNDDSLPILVGDSYSDLRSTVLGSFDEHDSDFDLEDDMVSIVTTENYEDDAVSVTATDGYEEDLPDLGPSADGKTGRVAELKALFEGLSRGSQFQGGKSKACEYPKLPEKPSKRRKRANSMDSDSMDSEDIYSVGDQESTRSQDTDIATKESRRQDTLVSGDFIARLAGCVGEKAKKPKSNGKLKVKNSKTNGGSKQNSGISTGSSTKGMRRFFRR